MKKMLLTASMLFVGVTATFAQVPDASGWQKGDDITDKVNWGNLSFSDAPSESPSGMNYWKLESTKGAFTKTGGLFEVYDGADVDLYQYVQLPAGMYRMEAQAYYRFGTSWAEDPTKFGTEEWQDLAQMYVQNGIYNIDSEEFTAGRTFQTPVMPRLFPMHDTQIYVDEVKEGWDMSDGKYTVNGQEVWGPCSVPGSLLWFGQGLYGPYTDEDNDIKYNTVSFFLTQDGYARVGISKKEAKEADSFMATNFKLYYEGPADEAVELMALQDEVQTLYDKLEDLMDANEGLLYTLINDYLSGEYDAEYGPASSMDKETCIAAKAVLGEYFQKANAAAGYIANIKTAIENAEALKVKIGDKATSEGIATFQAAIDEAKSCIDPNYEIQDDDNLDKFAAAYEALLNARMPFLLSQDYVGGSIDLTPLVSYPWFCLPQYEPTWDSENNCWVPNQETLDMPYKEGSEETWSQKDDTNGTIDNIAKGINVYNPLNTPNAWAQGGNGGNLEVYWNDKLPCIKKWAMPFDGYHEVSQVITNIPNGWYSLKALGQTWTNDWSNNCELHIAIEGTDMSSKSDYLPIGGWWGNDINQWKELSTDMILVTDGQVKIAAYDNGFAAWTGFRLSYYGETPDYSGLISADLEAAKAGIEGLAWNGDKAAGNAIMAELPAEINTEETFIKAKEVIAKANDYVAKANAAIAAFAAPLNFETLAAKYEAGSDENELLNTAWAKVIGVGDNDTDTYLDAIAADAAYAAYADYLAYRESFGALLENEGVKAAIAEQNTQLKANYATAEQIKALKEALALPYNTAVLASLGSDKATEANPVDITVLIANPSFDKGDRTGWDGDMTTDTIGVAERWNCDFDVSQTIYSLPAGCYRAQCQAFYRDGGDAGTAYKNWWNEALGEEDLWNTGNEIFYANERSTKVKSIASITPTEMSFTKYVEKWEELEEDAQGNMQYVPVWKEWNEETDGYNHPWDQKVTEGEDIFFYPNSIRGACRRFEANPEAYINTVEVMVEQGGKLTFGLKNTDFISNHWTVFDNFKLFYLGTEPTTGINGTAADAKASEIYTVSGVRARNMQKGINIIKMNDGSARKVVK